MHTGAARGGGIRETNPSPFERAQFHKNYLKKIKYQKANLKTLNSSVVLPWVANKQRQNFAFFENFL